MLEKKDARRKAQKKARYENIKKLKIKAEAEKAAKFEAKKWKKQLRRQARQDNTELDEGIETMKVDDSKELKNDNGKRIDKSSDKKSLKKFNNKSDDNEESNQNLVLHLLC